MAIYALGFIRITDPDLYKQYEAGFMAALAPHKGELLAVDEEAEFLEGENPGERVVVIRFPDRDALNAWYSSDAYQKIAAIRHKAASSTILSVRDLGSL